MQFHSAETNLVIAGAWNPAILTPSWVTRHGLAADPTNLQVQAFVPAVANFQLGAPRYGLQGFTYTVADGVLLLVPSTSEQDSLELVERVARGVLAQLPHTPLGGVGHNFEFRDEAPEPAAVEVFTASRRDLIEHIPPGWTAANTEVATTFANEAGTVLVNVQRRFERGGNCVVRFNFHHPASSVEEGLRVLTGRDGYSSMYANLQFARNMVRSLYGEARNE